jgi:hypothetical protein
MKTEKKCPRCQQVKSADNFFNLKGDGGTRRLSSKCKPCYRAHSKIWRKANPDKVKAVARRSYLKIMTNPESHSKRLAARRKLRTGLSAIEYERLKTEQAGRCAICFISEKELHRSLCADHCHITGKPRGLLCDKCNVVLGYFNDKPEALRAAADYLDKFRDADDNWAYAI